MGYDLNGRGGSLHVNIAGWEFVLERAQTWGWRPVGTLSPVVFNPKTGASEDLYGGQWDGNYTSNDYQTVTDDDARAMGGALQRAMLYADNPDERRILLRAALFAGAGEFVIG